MSGYISSNANRFYTALETNYGQAVPVSASNRFPATKIIAHQIVESGKRLDKTGSRTYLGAPETGLRKTAFEARSYLTGWNGVGQPCYGPLFEAGLGSIPNASSGLVVSSVLSTTQIRTAVPHGLSAGSGVSISNEIRFVTSAPDAFTLVLNAPFSSTPAPNSAAAPCISYSVATHLPSVTLYDYWDPSTAMSRMITGAAVDVLGISIKGDRHEFRFSGPAADLISANSFAAGEGGLSSYPSEPTLVPFDCYGVPGHLGQVWLGSSLNRFFTLTKASIEVKNNIGLRDNEFGSSFPLGMAAGLRKVISSFALLAQDDAQSVALYAAAKQRTLISAMLQLGQQQGQLMGIYLPEVKPEIPQYNDSETQLQWEFNNNVAQGTLNDEIYIAFA